MKLGACMDYCKRTRCHMLIVVDKSQKLWPTVGVVTTEDILEEIIGDEIVGDDDQVIDDAAASSMRPGLSRKNSRAYDPSLFLSQLVATRDAPEPESQPVTATYISTEDSDLEMHSINETEDNTLLSCIVPDVSCMG